MSGTILKSLISSVSIIINVSLFATFATSPFKFAADNVMLMHYFAFNIASNSFEILGKGYCSMHGYGEILSNLGSMLALTLITYRFSTYSKMSSLMWTMLIWAPIIFLGFLSSQDDGNTFVYLDQAGECVKESENNKTMWTILISFKIFLATLTLLLAFPASFSVYSASNSTVNTKRHAMLHLLIAIIVDSLLSGTHTITQLLIDGTSFQKVSHIPLYTLASLRLIFVPLLLLSLHSGIRNSFSHMLGYGLVRRTKEQVQKQSPSTQKLPVASYDQFMTSNRSLHSAGSNSLSIQPIHNVNSVEIIRAEYNQAARSRAISNSRLITKAIKDEEVSLQAALSPHRSSLTQDYKALKTHRSTEF